MVPFALPFRRLGLAAILVFVAIHAYPLAAADGDGDGIDDGIDNCPAVYNPAQTNTDNAWSNGPNIVGDDTTVANGDALGDACDADADNDGRLDTDELAGTGCPSASGDGTTEVSTSNGYVAGHPSWDTDGDVVPDGVECLVGTDPKVTSSADRNTCNASLAFPNNDDDGDGLSNSWEKCKWGTSPAIADSDGDGLGDCPEAGDVNGNGVTNAADPSLILRAVFAISVGDKAVMDINGNGVVNASDSTLVLQSVFGIRPCLLGGGSGVGDTGPAHLAIDADPTNGSGPCNPVDTTRTVLGGDTFQTAICLAASDLAPVFGSINTADVGIAYPAQLSAPSVASDLATDLDGNPDWDTASTDSGNGWDCNLANFSGSAPGGNPARIVCRTPNVSDNTLAAPYTRLASVTFDAVGSGAAVLTIPGSSFVLHGDSEADCGGIACDGATVNVIPSAAHIVVDADATNGAPCSTIDATRTVERGTSFTAAVCLTWPDGAPVNSQLTAAGLRLGYGAQLNAPDLPGDGVLDLNANPDWQEGAPLGGSDWDCNLADSTSTAPSGAPSPAVIACSTLDALPNSLSATAVPLAVVTMDALTDGTTALSLAGSSVEPVSTALVCGAGIECTNAAITVVTTTGAGAAHLGLDMNPSNGGGPCQTVDTAVTVDLGDPFGVAVCLVDSNLGNFGGKLNTATLGLSYPAGLFAPNVAPNNQEDLDSNPDWDQAATDTGGDDTWDCNLLNNASIAPKGNSNFPTVPGTGGAGPAGIVCSTTDAADNFVTTPNAHLATVTMNALAVGGGQAMSFSLSAPFGRSSVLTGATEYQCGVDIVCTGGTVNVVASVPRIVVDADATNGAPCSTIDTTRTVERGTSFTAAICLTKPSAAPVSSQLTAASLRLGYGAQLNAPDLVGDGVLDLNANPDWQEGAPLGGTDWDCNLGNSPSTAPSGTPSPAAIDCSTLDALANALSGTAVPLAIVSMDALTNGTTGLSLAGSSLQPVSTALVCGVGIVCTDASITVVTTPKLVLDMDPTDGAPCATIQGSAIVSSAAPRQVALCLLDGDQPPLNSMLSRIEASVNYNGALTVAPDMTDDGVFDLNANPDLNQGVALGGTDWDCNLGNTPPAAPNGTPPPASLVCQTVDALANFIGASPVHLATVTFDAASAGAQTLSVVGSKLFTPFAAEANCNSGLICGTGDLATFDTPMLWYDANPFNGSGPCTIPDTIASVQTGDTVDVAVCLTHSTLAPLSQQLSALNLQMSYAGTLLDAPDVIGDGTLDLDANPDLNQGGALGGADWDCNAADTPATAPSGTPPPASLACQTVDALPNTVAAEPVHLATLRLQGLSVGAAPLSFGASTTLQSGAQSVSCASGAACGAATINVINEPEVRIDADPTNGAGPCDVIDAHALQPRDATFPVAICLDRANTAPLSGTLLTLALGVDYPGELAGVPVASDLTTDLAGNPNLNEGSSLGGVDWDCNTLDDFSAAPTVGPPALIVCATVDLLPNTLAAPRVALATLTLRAPQLGLGFAVTANSSTTLFDGTTEVQCSVNLRCSGAYVDVKCLDGDIDCVPDAEDNCPTIYNPGQGNTDNTRGNGPNIPGDDTTVPNGDSLGDACDPDADNDSLPDALEQTGGPYAGPYAAYASCNGKVTSVNGDVSYADGNGTSWDTDGDMVPDGVECSLGTNPLVSSAADRSTCAASSAAGDSDGDGLQNQWEKCRWDTSVSSQNSDTDSLCDAIEAFDVNGNGIVSASDATLVKQAYFAIIQGDAAAMDINGNGLLNVSDATLILQAVFHVVPSCVP